MVNEDQMNLSPEQQAKLVELQLRSALAHKCIQIVSEVDPSDPRREGAIAEYNRQKAEIDAQIAEITGKPPAVVVGLQPAVITSRAEPIGGART